MEKTDNGACTNAPSCTTWSTWTMRRHSECEQLRGVDKYRNVCSVELERKNIINNNNNKVHTNKYHQVMEWSATYAGIERARESWSEMDKENIGHILWIYVRAVNGGNSCFMWYFQCKLHFKTFSCLVSFCALKSAFDFSNRSRLFIHTHTHTITTAEKMPFPIWIVGFHNDL